MQSAILGLKAEPSKKIEWKKKKLDENIAVQLLEQFDEESEGEGISIEYPTQQNLQ